MIPPMTTRRFGPWIKLLTTEPESVAALVGKMPDELLTEVAAAIQDEQRRRAVDAGDQDAVLQKAFERGFGRDGLATQPWIEGGFVVCPGGLVGKNRANHRCQFVSVDDTWVWDSPDLVHEEKRSSPGADEGFRAVALLPVVEGMALDVVRARMRQGQHQAESVTSYAVRRGKLVEVAQRKVSAAGAR
jgi:hypothetical protein